jgi:hypothetical protein
MCIDIDFQNVAGARAPQRKLVSLPFASQGMPTGVWVNAVHTSISNGSNDIAY